MIPNRSQYRKWSLPTKWSYWAAVIGIPVGVLSLALAVFPFLKTDASRVERVQLLFQVGQELRYNREWLAAVAVAVQEKRASIPVGSLKTEALMTLVVREYDRVTSQAYGEEKYIYQQSLQLKELGQSFGSPKTARDVQTFNRRSDCRLHDVLFLNDFLLWYLRPLLEKELDGKQLYSLGWAPFPDKELEVYGLKKLDMNCYMHEGKPITEFSLYLGLID